MQASQPFENAFMNKNMLFLINNQTLRDETILTYLNTKFGFIPHDNTDRTIIVNGNDLYFLGIVDNVFTFYSMDAKYVESTVLLLQSLTDIIVMMIKLKYATPSLANFISVKLCCYLPIDKKVPFGFIQQSLANSTDLFGNPLLYDNLVLYTKTFEFDEKYNLKTLSFEHMVDYTEMIRKFTNTNSMAVVSQPIFKKF